MRKSAINNSLLDLTDSSEKMARRGSVGSLDSGMSISFQSNSMFTSNNHNNSHQCSQNRNQRNNGSGPPQLQLQQQNSSKQHWNNQILFFPLVMMMVHYWVRKFKNVLHKTLKINRFHEKRILDWNFFLTENCTNFLWIFSIFYNFFWNSAMHVVGITKVRRCFWLFWARP